MSQIKIVTFLLLQKQSSRGVLQRRCLLEILQNSQENTCTRSEILLKKRLWQRCFPLIFFPVKFTNFLRTPFFTELLLKSFFFLRVFELFTRKVCEMFVYKHRVTTEYVKKQLTFYEKYKLYRKTFKVLYLYELEQIGRISNLHQFTFKSKDSQSALDILLTGNLSASCYFKYKLIELLAVKGLGRKNFLLVFYYW